MVETGTLGSAMSPAPRRSAAARKLAALLGAPASMRFAVLVVLAAGWQAIAVWQANPILLPTFAETARAIWTGVNEDGLLSATAASLAILMKGYGLAVLLAFVLVSLAIANAFAREALITLSAMFSPLPAIALLPLAMLWFGIGEKSLLFVLVHSVLWPFALALLAGFQAVPEAQRLVGRNYGLTGLRFVAGILAPASLPALLSGLKVGWAFAWRTLIAAELVFGISSRQGGLGWFIFRNRNELMTDKVFAGLAMVIAIGLVVEILVFRIVEAATVRRWGMLR